MKKALLVLIALGLLAVPVVAWVQVTVLSPPLGLFFLQLAWLLGVLGFVVLFFQFVLSSRVRMLERDVGLDVMIHLHRLTGVIGLSLVFLHAAAVTAYELIQRGTISVSLVKAVGIGAFLVMLTVAFAALFFKRVGWKYETWKRIHLASYVVFPLVFLHAMFLSNRVISGSTWMRAYWWTLLGIYGAIILYKVGVAIRVRRNPYAVASAEPASHDVTTVTFEGPQLEHEPGQFMLVSVEVNGRLEPSHPYTIASSPTAPGPQISAKAIGDFSSELRTLEPGNRAYIEGPYGVFSFLNHDAPSLVFIAGGIGITPFMSQLRYLRDTGLERKVRLIWGNKHERDICFRDELDAMKTQLADFDVVHVMSHQDDWPGERGFVTPDLVRRAIDDIQSATFFVCGPPAMMKTLLPALGEMGIERSRIVWERFALG